MEGDKTTLRWNFRVIIFFLLLPRITCTEPDTAAPANFLVTTINTTSVRLSWNLPSTGKQNGIIKGFRIFYRKKSVVSCQIPRISIPRNSTLHYIIGNLEANTEYTFKILAYATKEGPYSIEVTAKTDRITEKQEPKQVCAVETTLSHVLVGSIVSGIALVITLLCYSRHLRKFIKDFDSQSKKNFNDNSPDQSAYENPDPPCHGGNQMKDIPFDTSSVYDSVEHLQRGETSPHLSVYDYANPDMQIRKPLQSDAKQDASVYQSVDEGAIDSSYQGQSLYANALSWGP